MSSKLCPDCCSSSYEATTVGWVGGPELNPNRAICGGCGWRGLERDMLDGPEETVPAPPPRLEVEREGSSIGITLGEERVAYDVGSAGRARSIHQLVKDLHRANPFVSLGDLVLLAFDASDCDHPVGIERPVPVEVVGMWAEAARQMHPADPMRDHAWSIAARRLLLGMLTELPN